MLDYGFRSRCCLAPIKFGFKLIKNTKKKKMIFICTKCKSRDVPIIAKTEVQNQSS